MSALRSAIPPMALVLAIFVGNALAAETAPEPGDASAAPAAGGVIAEGLSPADTAWMLVCSALVLMMTAPGLALFYGGLVRKKNILGVMMQCVFLMGLMSVVWVLWGYSLAFGEDALGGFVGGLDKVGLRGVLPYWDDARQAAVVPMAGSIPESVFMLFQMMFFIITPALICGAFAERMKFGSMALFSLLWGTCIYCPICHWVWSANGWLGPNGSVPALDFAGGTVVHVSSGVSALVCSIVLGKRLGFGEQPLPPHNLTLTFIGGAMLWIGWFGFNAGSALAANASAVNAFVATHMAAACGVLSWSGAEWMIRGKPSLLGAVSGAVAGLVGVTPACGSVTPLGGMAIGAIAGLACYHACTTIKRRFGYDDSLDAFGVHGVGGALGALLTGVFATRAVLGTPRAAGVLEGNFEQFGNQAVSVAAAAGLAIVGTIALLKLVDALAGLRVKPDEEERGLDISLHGEEGYLFV
ncbi:MAG: ammonium transporter [Planctomycetales bacterium]